MAVIGRSTFGRVVRGKVECPITSTLSRGVRVIVIPERVVHGRLIAVR